MNPLSFSLSLYLFIRCASSPPFLLKSTWTSQDPSGRLSIPLFLTFAVPLSLHPSLLLSLHPSISSSICLSGLFSPDDCSCVFFSKQKEAVSPWGKIVLSSPQTFSFSPYLPPPSPNCLAIAPLTNTPILLISPLFSLSLLPCPAIRNANIHHLLLLLTFLIALSVFISPSPS